MIVLNHMAQYFPSMFTPEYLQTANQHDKKFYFDKVLADVPCSGDGATRKIPEKWLQWTTSDAMVSYLSYRKNDDSYHFIKALHPL